MAGWSRLLAWQGSCLHPARHCSSAEGLSAVHSTKRHMLSTANTVSMRNGQLQAVSQLAPGIVKAAARYRHSRLPAAWQRKDPAWALPECGGGHPCPRTAGACWLLAAGLQRASGPGAGGESPLRSTPGWMRTMQRPRALGLPGLRLQLLPALQPAGGRLVWARACSWLCLLQPDTLHEVVPWGLMEMSPALADVLTSHSHPAA